MLVNVRSLKMATRKLLISCAKTIRISGPSRQLQGGHLDQIDSAKAFTLIWFRDHGSRPKHEVYDIRCRSNGLL